MVIKPHQLSNTINIKADVVFQEEDHPSQIYAFFPLALLFDEPLLLVFFFLFLVNEFSKRDSAMSLCVDSKHMCYISPGVGKATLTCFFFSGVPSLLFTVYFHVHSKRAETVRYSFVSR